MKPVTSVRELRLWGQASALAGLLLFLWQWTFRGGWFEATLGPRAAVYWIGVVLFLALSFVAVRKRQFWWIIPVAPFALYPALMGGLVYAACVWGHDCP
jgi:hypothetical protein